MQNIPFFDPEKTYEDNFTQGPFGTFADGNVFPQTGKSRYSVFGQPVYLPFGIPAGPLLNGKYVKAALDKGFDIPVYKTIRTRKYASAPWPNVLSVRIPSADLSFEMAEQGLVADHRYSEPIAITNSFGVPSFEPDFWQADMADASRHARAGQLVVGSFQGTTNRNGDITAYIQDFVLAARLVKETGVKVLEANLSCPNEGTGHLLCYDTQRSKTILTAIKDEIGDLPLCIKIGYFKDQEQLANLIKEVGSLVQGISAINTIPAKIVDERGQPALPGAGRERSGVCGQPIKWAGLTMVQRLAALRQQLELSFTIIGVGGVTTANDYHEYTNAGADVVMSATGAMWHPELAQEIKATTL
ncbi:MAG TPA: tRNA-dihydrouridine synthase [Ktedonobacteraceae bacterium]|jgi:dihydroorotate dehydrogenase